MTIEKLKDIYKCIHFYSCPEIIYEFELQLVLSKRLCLRKHSSNSLLMSMYYEERFSSYHLLKLNLERQKAGDLLNF